MLVVNSDIAERRILRVLKFYLGALRAICIACAHDRLDAIAAGSVTR